MSSSQPIAAENERQAPIALWRAARALLSTVFDLFGAPEQLAARHTLVHEAHKLCTHWLGAAETLMRRLLFIEAALVELGPPAFSRHAGKAPARRQCRILGFDAEHPEQWRVSFRCFYGPPASRRPALSSGSPVHAGGTPAVHRRLRSAWPLAERMEALLRVCNNPAPYAKRLARRLRKKSALAERLRASWEELCDEELRDLVGRELHDALIEPTACAARVFAHDSS